MCCILCTAAGRDSLRRSSRRIVQIHLGYFYVQSHMYKRKKRERKKKHDLWPRLFLSNFPLFSWQWENTLIIQSKHIIALLIHILLSMSVLIKGEEVPVERYHARWLKIGGLNNQAKIKGRLCFRVSPFWSGLRSGGRGERGEKG